MGNTFATTHPVQVLFTVPETTMPTIGISEFTIPKTTTPEEQVFVPQTTVKPINICAPPGKYYDPITCNDLTECIFANNNCYDKTNPIIGLLDSTTIDCITNKNQDGSYNLIFKATTLRMIFIIKRIDFIIKDNNAAKNNPYLSATYINLDLDSPADKKKIYIINTNGSLEFKLKVNNSPIQNEFDFTSITLTDINNRSITLLSTNTKTNTINNRTSFFKERSKLVRINYDDTYAKKAKQIDLDIQNNLKSFTAQ
jgi:hypothetical protein